MSETHELPVPKIELEDIIAPELEVGGTAIVLQRHAKYDRNRDADSAGSIDPESAEVVQQKDKEFFNTVLDSEGDAETMILFVSSDTQYAGKGRRSLETGQLAQDAATEAMRARGIDPSKRIINFNEAFNTTKSNSTGQDIVADRRIREPKMFDHSPDFVKELGRMYNPEDLQEEIDARRTDVQLSPRAFAAYEADEPGVKELREKHGAEGVYDILDRTRSALSTYKRYARVFHAKNPDKRLIIWATSHYDTMSPLVKDETGVDFDEYLPVDYGAGMVMTISPEGSDLTLEAQGQKIPMKLGKAVTKESVSVE